METGRTTRVRFNFHRTIGGVIPSLIGFMLFCLVVLSCTRGGDKTAYYWVMGGPCPEDAVPIWFPAVLADHKDCEETKATPAVALMDVYEILNDVNENKVHYHIRQDDRGLVLTEFVIVPGTKEGERPWGRDEVVHYHGVCVDPETARQLVRAVKAHQHGT